MLNCISENVCIYRCIQNCNISIYSIYFKKIPTDMILLRTSEESGSCFIRTDQLDGETDWKLRFLFSFSFYYYC